MPKFFVQMLLPLMLGLSGEAAGTVHEAEAFVQGVVEAVCDLATNVQAGSDVSVDTSVEADVQVEAGAELDLNSEIDNLFDANAEGSISVEAETDAEVEAGDTSLDLESTLEGLLDLGLGE